MTRSFGILVGQQLSHAITHCPPSLILQDALVEETYSTINTTKMHPSHASLWKLCTLKDKMQMSVDRMCNTITSPSPRHANRHITQKQVL